ncbi:MAG TPA: sugar phosphate isomerase/epimerase [Gemmataceae bacterium]|nr:sugar phosphate isomerase/epimerase [Gemmataceae bacterium]
MSHPADPFPIAAMLTSLPLDFGPAARQAAALGFHSVDVVGLAERPTEHLEALAETGLLVSCAAVGRGLPDGAALDSALVERRRAAVEEVRRQVADAARLGATHCYVVPGLDTGADGVRRFGDSCVHLAEHAAGLMVRLCVEHVPGRALPTAAATLAWLAELRHDNLFLLLDTGHCLMTGEDAADVVRRAGQRMGYVHCDDNDGAGDLHWPLLVGRLTRDGLRELCLALRSVGYRGPLSLELNPANADPVGALREGKDLLEGICRLAAGRRPAS